MNKNKLQEIIKNCQKNKKAILHLNINNFSQLYVFLKFAKEKKNSSFMIAVCQEVIDDFFSLELITHHFHFYKKKWNLQNVFLHLDHCQEFEFCQKVLEFNFDSIMFDGSKLSFSENVSKCYQLKKLCSKKNVLLEVEVGSIDNKILSNLNDIKIINQKVAPDLLAISFGNYHGFQKKNDVTFDWHLLQKINNNFDIPLVLHGGSGLKKEVLKKSILNGIVKINFDSIFQKIYFSPLKIKINKIYQQEKFWQKELFLVLEKMLKIIN